MEMNEDARWGMGVYIHCNTLTWCHHYNTGKSTLQKGVRKVKRLGGSKVECCVPSQRIEKKEEKTTKDK
jgi:hypothetical protein